MSWLNFFTSVGKTAVKESAEAAKVLSKSGTEMAEQAARSVGVHAGQAEQVAEQAMKSSESLNRSASQVADEVARMAQKGNLTAEELKTAETLSRVSKNLTEASSTAAKNVKEAASTAEHLTQSSAKAMESAKTIGEQSGKTKSMADKYAAHKLYAMYGVGGYLLFNKVFYGKGLLGSASEVVLDDPKEGEGMTQAFWRQLVGDSAAEKPLVGAGVDTIFGDGTYDGSVALLKRGGNAVGDTFTGISDTLQGFLHRAGGPGMPYPQTPYYDPTYYNVAANPQNYAGLTGERAFVQQASLMDGVYGRLNNLTGMSNINGFNLAEMALAAFLTFGPFGKIAKIGGLLLGANSYKSMNQSSSVTRQQQNSVNRSQEEQQILRRYYQSLESQSKQPTEEVQDNIVYRSRSI